MEKIERVYFPKITHILRSENNQMKNGAIYMSFYK